MDVMETPLDVLSRAATLIHDQLKSAKNDDSNQVRRELIGYDDDDDDQWNSAASKELPTRAKKERRRHERHHELVSASAASRNIKSHHHHRKTLAETSAPEELADRPLDMSTNSRRPSAPASAHSSGRSPPPYPLLPAYPSGNSSASGYPMYPSPPDYIARPSVITCASSLRSSPAPSCPSPCSSTGSVSSRDAQDRRTGAGSPLPLHHRSSDTGRIPHRHISSGMSDPVIDEHFRRSLGERYTHLFASSTSSASSTSLVAADSSTNGGDPSRDDKLSSTVNVTGLSVDDHFAKALGETWLKLQNENKDKEMNGAISDSQPGSPMTTQRPGLVLT